MKPRKKKLKQTGHIPVEKKNNGKSVPLMICVRTEKFARKKLKTKYKTNRKYLVINVISS